MYWAHLLAARCMTCESDDVYKKFAAGTVLLSGSFGVANTCTHNNGGEVFKVDLYYFKTREVKL